MIINDTDLLLIPFGAAEFHARHFGLAGFSPRGLEITTAVPHAIVSRRAALPVRFNNGPVQFIIERTREDLSGIEAQYELLKANLERICGDYQAPVRAFLARYLADVESEIERASDELAQRAAPFSGLFEPRHWIFSALMPLPRAFVHLPAVPGGLAIDPEDVVRVDFAFWTGTRLVAVVIDTGTTVLPRRRRALDRLGRADLDLVTFTKADIAGDASLLEGLGPRFAQFWQDEPLPSGPFKGSAVMGQIERAG